MMKYIPVLLLLIFSSKLFSQSPDTLYPVKIYMSDAYQYGYINHDGKIKILPQYAFAKDFSNGLAFVKQDNNSSKWHCINTDGKVKFEIDASYVYDFDYYQAKILGIKDSTYFIDTLGNKTEYSEHIISELKNIPVPFYEGDKWGYKIGPVVIVLPAIYEKAGDFSEGLAPVFIKFNESDLPEDNCYNAFINGKGNVVIKTELKYDDMGHLESGYFYSPEKWVNGVCRYYSTNDPKTRVEKYIRNDGKIIW